MKVLVKKHETGNTIIISICDKELFKKEIVWNGVKIKIEEPFYGGTEYDINYDLKILEDILSDFDVINAIGKYSVELLKKLGIIQHIHILFIGDIPHVQIYRI